jgi:hypothetical protein
LRLTAGGHGIYFNPLIEEVKGTTVIAKKTEENKHTLLCDGVNFVGKCDNHNCRIYNKKQYFKKGFGYFSVNKEVFE